MPPLISIMILTGPEIEAQVKEGNITISPFDPHNVGPNSVDLCLHKDMLVYDVRRGREPEARPPQVNEYGTGSLYSEPLDMKADNRTQRLEISSGEGTILDPGRLYLCRTIEEVGSTRFVPIVEGRSSIGRLGIHVHVTAGFCDIGFRGTITLEVHVIHPVRIYPNIPFCQVYFLEPRGELKMYEGRYQGQTNPVPSRFGEPQ